MHIILRAVVLLLLGLAVSGCGSIRSLQPSDSTQTPAIRTAQPGDRVDIHYLCRIRSGEIAAATDIVSESDPKSNIFVMSKGAGPLSVIAARPDEPLVEQFRPAPFDIAIRERLRRMVAGMSEGETRQVELTAQMIPGENEQSGFARLSRIRTRPKETKMPKGEYEFLANKTPEVGQDFAIDPAFPGRVRVVTDTDVVVRYSAKPGDSIETPFGPGLIREEGENYKVDINAKEGSLVRTGNKIGRISHVDDKVITVDYRHAFGYETLSCEVTARNITEADLLKIDAGAQ